ncbi:MAG: hypothetical protein AAFV53_03015 [Myxococcota bacterium]
MGRIVFGRGKAQIELSGGTRDAVERALKNSLGTVYDQLQAAAKKLYQDAQKDWPEKTGKSKAALMHGIRLPNTNTVEAFVGFDASKAPYVWFIREPYPHNNRYVWRRLVRTPGRRLARKLAEQIGDELRRNSSRRRSG